MKKGDRMPEYECVFCAHRFRRLSPTNPNKCPSCGRGNKVDRPVLMKHGVKDGNFVFFWPKNWTLRTVRWEINKLIKEGHDASNERLSKRLKLPLEVIEKARLPISSKVVGQRTQKDLEDELPIEDTRQMMLFEV